MAGVTFGPDAWAGSGETFDIITPSGHGEDYRLVARWKGPAVGCYGFVGSRLLSSRVRRCGRVRDYCRNLSEVFPVLPWFTQH